MEVDALGGTMTINDTRAADAGDYACVAGNSAGTSSGSITLDVGGELRRPERQRSITAQQQRTQSWSLRDNTASQHNSREHRAGH